MVQLAKVSVVIPVDQTDEYLTDAIESVVRQSTPPAEVIVVGEGLDIASEALRPFGESVRAIRSKQSGIWGSCNLGITLSHGEYLAFLGPNDVWVADKLESQLAMLAAKPSIDVLLGHSSPLGTERTERDTGEREARGPSLRAGTMLLHRQAFVRVGYFATERESGSFGDWLTRARAIGLNIDVAPGTVLLKRKVLETVGAPDSDGVESASAAPISSADRESDALGGE